MIGNNCFSAMTDRFPTKSVDSLRTEEGTIFSLRTEGGTTFFTFSVHESYEDGLQASSFLSILMSTGLTLWRHTIVGTNNLTRSRLNSKHGQ